MDQDAHMRRIIDNLSSDLNNLSSESKRKFAPVKEACEASLLKLRQINSLKTNLYKTMCDASADLIKPLILGCETKQSKIIQICLTSAQKVIEAKILNINSATILINTLWQLTDAGQEELKVLQTIILLVTTTDVVKHQLLAKTLTIGLRIASSKDQIVMNTATAMLSQMVTKVFERVLVENKLVKPSNDGNLKQSDIDHLKMLSKEAPAWMNESAQDAYMLLQDIYLLLNSDHSLWLININEINKPFGLELLKSILVRYTEIFFANPEMSFMLKERVCPLLIKLFSPTTKLKINSPGTSSLQSASTATPASANDQKTFAVVSRLIRIVFILIKSYFELLVTESEIFLSLLAKFLDIDRPIWQKALAIEAFHKISVESRLIRLLVVNYDMKQHPEKIFSLITNGIALFIQSLFLNAATTSTSGGSNSAGGSNSNQSHQASSSQLNQSLASSASSSSVGSSSQSLSNTASGQQVSSFAFQISSAQPSFIYKDTTIQLLFPYISGQVKSLFLDGWDKLEIPYIQDGYLLSIGFSTLQELCKSVQSLIDQNLAQFQQETAAHETKAEEASPSQLVSYKKLNITEERLQTSTYLNECIQLMNACSNNFLFVYNILLESSLDESITDQIIKSVRTLIYICATLNLKLQRDAFVTLLCKAALPSNYAHNVLNLKSLTDLSYTMQQSNGHSGQQHQAAPVYSSKTSVNKTNTAYDDSSEKQIQVVAIGPALHLAGANSTNSGGSHQVTTLCITAKNLLTMKSILNMSHLYAELLGSSWYIVLNTLQHLTWTLGLKPTIGSNGQLKHLNNSILPAGGTTATAVASSQASAAASAGASSSSGCNSAENQQGGSMITTAIQTEIAFICNMLTKLFEASRAMSDAALEDIIDSLLKLSVECSDLAYVRAEPCLFPLAKLYETSIVNLIRIDLFWQKVTMHLLCSCKHGNIKYREWCVDFICNMIRATFNYKYTTNSTTGNNSMTPPSSVDETGLSSSSMRDIVLKPLHELSSINYNDIRQKQIECTLTILRLTGPSLSDAWPLCLSIIGAIQPGHTDALIRAAFQCLQLVVTDFLATIRPSYLSLVMNVVAKFGAQEQDLNIALTAIVLLWNISDYMFQNIDRLNEELAKNTGQQFIEEKLLNLNLSSNNNNSINSSVDFSVSASSIGANESTETVAAVTIESIWMVLYSRLGQLCVDGRPAIRKSACQTLFCTISSHGSALSIDQHWISLVWRVLFPLLEQVRHLTSTASRERDKHPHNPNFLMHHSRDTAEKQWAETSVLTLAGVTRVFNAKYAVLIRLTSNGEFHRMWLFLLGLVQSLALSRNSEIAQAALRGFHELLGNQNYFSSASSFISSSNTAAQTVAAAVAAASAVTNVNNGGGGSAQQLSNGGAASSANSSTTAAKEKKKPPLDESPQSAKNAGNTPLTAVNGGGVKSFEIAEWLAAWKTWLDIGNSLLCASTNNSPAQSDSMTIYSWPPPGQTYLTCYIDLVSVIVDRLALAGKFTTKDFENFSQIMDKLLAVPVLSNDYSSFILMQAETNLTPLQSSCLNTIKNFIKLFKTADASFQDQFISLVFHRLLAFVLFACYNNNPISAHLNLSSPSLSASPTNCNEQQQQHQQQRPVLSGGPRANDIVTINCVLFGEKALLIATNLYEETSGNEAVVENFILKTIIQTLYVPLSLKYSCPNPSTWKLSIECLFKILKKALPTAQKNKSPFESMWLDLAKTFEDFLFTKNIASADLSLDLIQKDELVDCQVIELIRDDILAHSAALPQTFVQKILAILNRGSIYSNNFENFIDLDSTKKMREQFSKTCFETLLRFSFVNENVATNGEGNLTKMALSSMLTRCKEIVQRYAHDERLNGSVPLPRARTNEMLGVLKALCTLISALKKAPKESIQVSIWNQVIGLYPSLVECTTSPTPHVCNAVKETLHHYFSFLKLP